MRTKIQALYEAWNQEDNFSGVFSVQDAGGNLFEVAAGSRNMGERLPNNPETRFGIASGTKIFTAVAVCMLIDQGKLRLEDKLLDILDADFPHFSPAITVEQLLTHTAGVPDYFDESVTDDFEAIWADNPVYKLTTPKHFLPLFQAMKMNFEPGARFAYSNSGYILLGLIVETISGQSYQEFVTEHVLKPSQMANTGFFRMDMLPENTARGHIYDEDLKGWRTNIFSVPVIGGPDGGLFTTAADMKAFWEHLIGNKLLSEAMTQAMLAPRATLNADVGIYYGLGVYMAKVDAKITRYYVLGADPGVQFFSAYYPLNKATATALANTESNIFYLLKEMNEIW